MLSFLKAGRIFFLSLLVFLISSLQYLYAQCSFTNLNSSYCLDESSFALTGGTNYFGPGVTGNSFDPGAAGVGTHQLVTTNGLASSYSIVTSGTFNPEPPVSPTVVTLNDNDEQLVNIGFTFNFFGTDYTQLRIGSNGILGLGAGPTLTSVNENQALSDATNPNNIIALAWDDLTPDVSGTIHYFVVGTAPFRKFVVDYIAVDRTTTFDVTVQAQLYETTNIIEIHTTNAPFATNGQAATQGIESQDLGSGVTTSYGLPARSDAQWDAANDFISFVPTCLDVQTVTINALPSAALSVSPAATSVCSGSSVSVTIISAASGVLYQLRNSATDAPLSGYFLGSGGNLVINSNAISANVTIKVYARHATTLCETDLSNQVAVTVAPAPTVAAAGTDQNVCGTTTTLAANVPMVGSGVWSFAPLGNPDGLPLTAFSNTASATSDFSGTAGLTYILRWTISNGGCSPSVDDVQVRFDANPLPAANAGTNQTLCSTSATLAGNAPTTGTGTWTVMSGAGGSFVNANSPTTVFNGVSGTTYDLQWTISNGVCPVTSDIVQIQFNTSPTVATAGPDQTLCSTSATLAANNPVIGTGQWTIVSGAGGSFVLDSNPTTTFNGVAGTTYVLQWTITSGVCTPSSDQVSIRFDANPLPAANAGTDQTLCSTSATLAGNAPTTGTGTWTVVSGAGGSFVNANSPTTVFNGVSGTTYDLQWTISNGVCPASSDIVQIQFNTSPTVATAGPDQTLCSTSATLAANNPVIGTGQWTIVSGAGGSFVLDSNPTTTFNGVAGTTYVLQWTITSGVCTPSSDQVSIRFDANPLPAANAGTNQTLCSTSATLAGNAPTTGTGTWTVVSGAGGSFVNANSPTTVFNGVSGTTYDLQWTISNGVCPVTSDIVQIQFNTSPTVATAGPDQTLCSTSATLAANNPVIGTGQWTIVSGAGGSFVLDSNPTTTFNGVAGTTYVLQWTITSGVCTPSSDQVSIRFDANPLPAANAGTNQTLCSTSATLAGNAPTTGTGTWTVVSGAGGSFVNANSPTTVFNGVSGTTYDLQWTISNGVCPVTSDIVQIQFNTSPTVATAGPDQTLCSTSATLAANNPVIGTGQWTIVSGAGGSFVLDSNPTTTFNGVAGTTYVLQWTITSGVCTPSSDQVSIRFDANPLPAANAGTNQTLCSTSATLTGNAPTTGTGTWTVVSGAGGSFVNANSPTTVFNGVSGTTYDLQWTISNGVCPVTSDIVQIQFNTSPTVATAGPDQTLCSTSATLAANNPVIGTGQWTIVSGAGGSFVLDSNPTTTFNGVAGTTYVLQWTITSGVCTPSSDQVSIRFDANPLPAANAGTNQTLCSTSATLAGNAPTTGTGTWTVVSGAGGSFVNANSPTTVFNGVSGTTYDLQWTISNGVCPVTSDIVQIQFNTSPTVATAGPDQTLCSTSATLAANNPVIGTGQWTIVSGAGGSFVLDSNPTTTFNGVAGTTYVLQWTITSGVCTPSSDQVSIRFDANPLPAANAGTDQTLCSTSATLAGNAPTTGTGTWTVVSGAGGSFVNANSPTTVFNGVSGTTYDLQWTISNGVCPASSDIVQIQFNTSPTVATAGPDQTLCSTSATLAANNPVIGTGQWTIVSGAGGSFVLDSNPTTTFNGVAGTTYVLQWTITSGVCTPSSDQVSIRFDANPLPAANAGTNQTLCSTSATLAGNAPTTGTGTWTVVSGAGGSFVNANSPTTVFNGVSGTTYDLQWTISNGVCPVTSDIVQIQFNTSPTVATAGPDQTLCSTSATLAANNPVIGTGQWTIVSGAGGSFVLDSNPTTTFNGVAGTTYVLQWTITSGVCTPSSDQVSIRFDANPLPAANAGTNQTLCSTSATLAGNAPTTGTGTWTVVSGAGGSFVNANSPTTVFNGVSGTTYDLQWTISNGVCPVTSDIVQIQFNTSPTVATAGPDQTLCSTSATLAANNPVIGTGQWTIVSGAGGSFVLDSNPTTTFNGVAGTTYVLQWTITSGVCTPSSDQVSIRFDANPLPAANAGTNQTLCSTSATLTGNAPTTGTGTWTVVSGAGGSFVNANSPTTVFNGVSGTTYDLQWTISNGVCPVTSDIVQIQFNTSPTVATAGPDQTLCSTSATLAANNPVIGTGQWTIVSGAGGSFVLDSNPTTTFNGVAGTTYVLQWTITSGVCTPSSDQVSIRFDANPLPAANAGTNQTLCSTSATLAGNAPTTGTGTWTVVSGAGGSFVNANSPTTVFNGVSGTTYDLQWTISNGVCPVTSDIVQIQFNTSPTVATAGPDQTLCSTSATLAANNPVIGTGQWTIVSGAGGSFVLDSNPTTTFNGVAGTTYVLQWTITSGVCTPSSDQVSIRFDANPLPAANAGTNQTLCSTSATLAGNAPTTGTGTWTVVSGAGGSFVNANSPTTVFNGVSGTTYDLQWTISNGVCPASSDIVQIQFNTSPTVATAGPDQTLCSTSATLAANNPVIGTGQWTIVSGAGGSFVLDSNPTTTFNGVAGTTYVLQWTITSGVCTPSSDQVSIRFDANPLPAANAGTDQTLCSTSATLAGNAPTTGTGTWTVMSGAGGSFVNANSPTTVFNGVSGTTYDLQWTISNGVCPASSDIVQIQFNTSPTVATAGPDQTLCSTSATLAANNPVIGTGQWTIVSGAGGSFVLDSNPTTTFNGVAGTTYVLQWTITSGVCTPSSDQVSIRFDANPLPAANAGTDQTLCSTSATLAGNAPTTGTGTWTVVSGAGGSFVNANSPTTVFNGVSGTTYDLQWTISNGVCPASSDIVQIQFNTSPTVATAGPDQTLCSTSATLAANNPVIGTGQWTIVSGAGGSFVLDSNPTTTFNGVAGTTYVLQWTITSGVCTPSSDQVSIRFDANPLPAANAGTNQTLCSTSATLAGNAPTTGTGTWTVVSGAGGSFVNANSPTTVFNGVSGTTYDLQWTISNGVCPASSDIVQIQFDLPPTTALAGPNQNLCAPTAVLAGNNPVVGTGLWTIVSGAGGSFVNANNPTTTFNGISGSTYILRWTTSNGVCSTQDEVQIHFYPIPDADAADKTICSGSNASVAIDNPNGVAGTTFSWTVLGSTNVTGATGGNGSLISQILSNTDPVNSGSVVYRIVPSANGCPGTPIDVTVSVSPKPFVTDPPTSFIQEICSGTPFIFTPTSPVPGTTYNWTTTIIGTLSGVGASGSGTTITDNPVNSTNSNGVIIYTITPTIGGCDGTPVNLVVTVRPVTSADATDQTICSGESTSISILNPNNVAGTTYSWTAVATNVSGASNGSGSTISQLLVNTHGSINGSVVYTITPSANGCPGPSYDVTAIVKPVPVMTNPVPSLSQQICSGDALNFVPTSTIGGATFSWVSSFSGPIDPASVTASGSGSVTDSPVNTGNVAGTVTYRITPTYNGCNGLPADLVVTVKPEPSSTASNLTICSGQAAIINITPLPKNVSGTTFAWTAVGSPNVTGWANGNGSTINQTLSTTDQFVGTITYTIVPTANSCDGAATNITVTVNPVATANAGANFAVCEPTTIPLTGTIGGSAATGTWSIVPGFGSGTISTSTTTGGTVTATYTVNPSDIGGQVKMLLTSNDPDGVGPCTTASDELIVDVNRRPVVAVPADYTVCEPSSINLTGSLSGSANTGVWSLLAGTGTLSASSVTGSNVTASYSPSASDVGTLVRFRLTSNVTGVCAAAFDDIEIRINETARVNAGVDFEVCEDEVINLNGSFSGATGSVTWTGGAGGTFSNASNPSTSYTLTAADIAAGGITFSLTSNDPDGGGASGPCGPVTDQVFVKINKLPEVFLFGLQPTYAENNPVVSLDGIPVGGTFTGSGIIAGTNQFDPGSASLGPVQITYTYTNPATGCTNSVQKQTIVNPVTSIDFDIENQTTDLSGNPQICANSGLLELIGYPAASTGYPQTLFRSPDIPARIQNIGLSDFYINTDGLAPGTYQIQYIYTNSLLATDTLTKAVTVFAAPKAVIDFDRVCVADSLTYTDASFIPINPASATIVAYDWSYGEFGNGNDGVTRNPKYKYADHGSKTVGLTVTTSQGCTHDTTRTIRVGPLPIVDFSWSKVCSGLEVTEFRDLSTTPLGYSEISEYQWDFGDGDLLAFGPRNQNIPPGTHSGRTTGTYTNPNHDYNSFTTFTVQLTVNTEDGCTGTKANNVIILDYVTPTASGGYSTDFEIGSNPWVVSTTSTNSSWIYGVPSGNVIQPSASGNYAWWTGNNADSTLTFSTFNNDETSEVLSPCLNLTDLKRPMISLDYWSDMTGAFDGAVVQFSTDDGTTWQTIGNADGYGINWYDTQNITSNVGGQDNFAWSGSKPTEGWMNARFNLDQIPPAERDLVRFRIAFASNGDNPTGEILNGFAFDNIYVGEKNRNVLVEHFTNDNSASSNNSDQFLEDMYNDQIIDKDSSDFIVVQYHMAGDDINLENPADPTARQQLYGVSQAPTTVMDGIQGQYFDTNFNGLLANITAQEIDRRALEDPSFAINIDTVATGDNATLGLNIRYTYIDSLKPLDVPVTFHAALVERGINGNGNVVRKLLLGSDGHTITTVWDANAPTIHDEIFDYTLDIPVTNPDSLYILAFVQDNSESEVTSRRILQSRIVKAPRKVGPVITGIEDSPTIAELKGLVVYPNPASKFVNLHSDINFQRNYTWKMIDQRGVTVLTGNLQKDFSYGDQAIEVSNLPNGMYIMAIQINDKSVVHKKIAVMNRD